MQGFRAGRVFRLKAISNAIFYAIFFAMAGYGLTGVQSSAIADNNTRPNILVIVADDLGYSDIGAYGGEINTPNLNALAEKGLLATNFYTAATCAPTRAMLLSGADSHPVGLATMPGHLSSNQAGKPGYEMYLNERALSVAELLRQGGYHTYIVGKWHVGSEPAHYPNKRGFERSFVLLEGGGSHFEDRRGPTSVFTEATYVDGDRLVEKLPKGFFSTEYYTSKIIDFINKDKADGKPFFAILAYTAPHWPLHAPAAYLDKYRGAYDQGYQAVAARRIENLREKGFIDSPEKVNQRGIDDWQQLDAEQRKIESRKMEIYAAMVEQIDANIGRLFAYLKQSGVYDNTLIVFLSDNGPEGKNPLGIHNNKEWVPANFNTELKNFGKAGSFVFYGPNWAQISALPYRGYKATHYEGGIKAPLIIHYPGKNLRTGMNRSFMSVKDLAPTFIDLVGLNGLVSEQIAKGKVPMSGRSLLPFLKKQDVRVHPENVAMGWEIFGSYGVRKGHWKAVHTGTDWELFNLQSDPGETTDLANRRPEKLKELIAFWDDYKTRNGVYLPTEDIGY